MAIFGIPYPNIVNVPGAKRVPAGFVTLGVLIGLTLIGDGLVGALHLPVPGPLVGSAILVAWLMWRPAHAAALAPADGLIAALPLLFLPLLVQAVGPLRELGPALLPAVITMAAATVAALVTAVAAARIAAWLCSRSR